MTHYNENPGIVRCDVFKAGGKWYETIALDMNKYYLNTITPYDGVILALNDAGHYKIGVWNFFVAEPYHKNGYPVMIPFTENGVTALAEARRGMEYMERQLGQ